MLTSKKNLIYIDRPCWALRKLTFFFFCFSHREHRAIEEAGGKEHWNRSRSEISCCGILEQPIIFCLNFLPFWMNRESQKLLMPSSSLPKDSTQKQGTLERNTTQSCSCIPFDGNRVLWKKLVVSGPDAARQQQVEKLTLQHTGSLECQSHGNEDASDEWTEGHTALFLRRECEKFILAWKFEHTKSHQWGVRCFRGKCRFLKTYS